MLNISNVILGYDNKPVLHFEGLRLSKGEQCLITGISGSGKTTLLYAIAGLVPVMKGQITIDNTEITRLSEAQRDHFRGQHIGIVFQTFHLIKNLSILDNLLVTSYFAGLPQDKKQAEEVLKKLDIFHKKDDLPETLSQGQAQRVAIARAFLHSPALVLADEPTSSLDDHSCETVINLLQQLTKEMNTTLVISSHDNRIKARFDHVIQLGGK